MSTHHTDMNIQNSFRNSSNHRSHGKKLFHFYSRTDVRKYFFANNIVNVCNSLDPDIINFSLKKCKGAIYSQSFVGRSSVYVT